MNVGLSALLGLGIILAMMFTGMKIVSMQEDAELERWKAGAYEMQTIREHALSAEKSVKRLYGDTLSAEDVVVKEPYMK